MLFLSFGFLGKTSFLDDRQIPDRMKNPVFFFTMVSYLRLMDVCVLRVSVIGFEQFEDGLPA